jgi:uncharacterized protein (DUF1330 family)
MAKGYWLAQVDVTDPDGYKEYVAANQLAFGNMAAVTCSAPDATNRWRARAARVWR